MSEIDESAILHAVLMEDIESTEATMHLRWSKDGVLQQAFRLVSYPSGRTSFEWRDVPTEK